MREHQEARQPRRPPQKWRVRPRDVAIVAGGLLLLGTVLLAGFTFLYGDIHHGIQAGQLPLGGMSQTEAENFIDSSSVALFSDGTAVQLSIKEQTYPVVIGEVASGMDSRTTALAAYEYTHAGNPLTRMGHVLGALFGGHEVPLAVSVNHEKLAARLTEISDTALTAPVDPSWELAGDELLLDRGTPGVDFDRAAVDKIVTEHITQMDFEPYVVEIVTEPQAEIDVERVKSEVDSVAKNASVDKKDGKTILPAQDGVTMDLAQAQAALDGAQGAQSIRVPITHTPAEVTAEQLRAVLFRDTLATAQTNFASSGASRANNVRLASSFIDGIILNPGEEFSYNGTVGERTAARGFRAAGAYVSGKLVDEVGGGVCQPSSTLYMAVLRADLKVTERTNHGFTVAYTPLGEDATVSYGALDFCFQNNTAYPVKLLADSAKGTLRMTIIGTKTTDKAVKTEREVVATYAPKTIEKPDASLEVGKTVVEQKPTTGYKVVTYQIITQNGKTTKVKANTSVYKKRDKIVRVGTKPVSVPAVGGAAPADGAEAAPPPVPPPHSTEDPE